MEAGMPMRVGRWRDAWVGGRVDAYVVWLRGACLCGWVEWGMPVCLSG